MAIEGYTTVPEYMPNTSEWCRRMAAKIGQIMRGKTNNIDEVTLTANSATTTITLAESRIGQNTVILFMPITANAAIAAQTMYVSSQTPLTNTFVITHANNAQSDKSFRYALIG
jgi:hypothetical protein